MASFFSFDSPKCICIIIDGKSIFCFLFFNFKCFSWHNLQYGVTRCSGGFSPAVASRGPLFWFLLLCVCVRTAGCLCLCACMCVCLSVWVAEMAGCVDNLIWSHPRKVAAVNISACSPFLLNPEKICFSQHHALSLCMPSMWWTYLLL